MRPPCPYYPAFLNPNVLSVCINKLIACYCLRCLTLLAGLSAIQEEKNIDETEVIRLIVVAHQLLIDTFYIQRKVADKILTIRVTNPDMFIQTCVARVSHSSSGMKVEDYRNLIYYVMSSVRLLSEDTVDFNFLAYDGDFSAFCDSGVTRPTSAKQLMDESMREATALEVHAKSSLGVSIKGNISDAAKAGFQTMFLARVM